MKSLLGKFDKISGHIRWLVKRRCDWALMVFSKFEVVFGTAKFDGAVVLAQLSNLHVSCKILKCLWQETSWLRVTYTEALRYTDQPAMRYFVPDSTVMSKRISIQSQQECLGGD